MNSEEKIEKLIKQSSELNHWWNSMEDTERALFILADPDIENKLHSAQEMLRFEQARQANKWRSAGGF